MSKSLFSIVFTVFLDLLGYGLVIPVIAPIFLSTSSGLFPINTPESTKTITMGILIALFPLMQFFSAPILGALSDRYGRKRLLQICIVGTGFGYLLFGIGILTHQLWLLFVGRIIDGITGGNISIATSAIADISTEKTKPKNFGLIGMAFGLGFIIGPFLGGELSNPNLVSYFNFATPFWTACILCIINLVLVNFFFPETIKKNNLTSMGYTTALKNIQTAFTIPKIRNIFFVSFLVTFSFSLFTQFIQIFLIKHFSWNQSDIGKYFAYIGLSVAFVQAVVVRKASIRFTPGKILSFSLFFFSISLLLQSLANSNLALYLTAPAIALFNGLTTPNITTLISNLSPKNSQGETLGLSQSVQSLAQTIPPILGGIIVSYAPATPIIASSVFMFLAWFIFLKTARKTSSY